MANVLEVLREKTPVLNKKGYRKSKYTQWIQPEYGHSKLKEHLNFVTLLAKASGYNWNSFKSLLDKSYHEKTYPFNTLVITLYSNGSI